MNKNLPMYLIVGAGALVGLYFLGSRMRPMAAWTETVTPKIVTAPSVRPKNYTVVKGDSLSLIAGRYNLALVDLLALNPQFKPVGLRDPNVIHPGENIRVSA